METAKAKLPVTLAGRSADDDEDSCDEIVCET